MIEGLWKNRKNSFTAPTFFKMLFGILAVGLGDIDHALRAVERRVGRVFATRRQDESAAPGHGVDLVAALGVPFLVRADQGVGGRNGADQRNLIAVFGLGFGEIRAIVRRIQEGNGKQILI